ncbi:MAG: hypothetical protein QNK03_08540 [Myxococcota bacterium]|nr:hypothetical protein [Myxococcota bacterium]
MAAIADSDPGRELVARIRDLSCTPAELAACLDGWSHEERVRAVRSVGRADQRILYDKVRGFRELSMTDMVPAAKGALEPVHHYGKNTLPAFSHFEKRFCRPPDADAEKPEQLWGYNETRVRPLVGPGYFVLRPGDRGELLVDYNLVPPDHPAGWPEIRRNERGVSRFVYGFMIDTLRGVSEHVSIGSAARRGRDMGSWFLLTREG